MKLFISLSILAACGVGIFECHAEDWPNWRGPEFNGISRETLPEKLPEELPVLWRTRIGIGFSSVAVQSGRMLTMGNQEGQDTVWCLDANTGDVLWKHVYPCELDPRYYEGGPSATPTIHQGAVYTLSKKGHAYCFDLETGAVIWRRDLVKDHEFEVPEWSFASSPFIEGERILCNVGRGGLALNRKTGQTLWMPDTQTSGYATVVPFRKENSGATHLMFSARSLFAFDAETGKAAWDFPWKCSRDVNAADPLVMKGRVLVSNSTGTVLLEPRTDGTPPAVIWEQRDLKWYFNAGVILDGHVYSLHGTTHRPTELTCTNLETGEPVWSEPGFGSGGLMAAENTVVLFDQGILTLFEASPEGFQPQLQQKILDGKCWTVPVLANGKIYVRNAEGDLACVALR